MFRSLTNSMLGNSRFRRATSLGLAGVIIAATGFGLTQMPAQSGDASTDEAATTVAMQADSPLAPIPGPAAGQTEPLQGESPNSVSPLTTPDDANAAPQNPYAQAQYTDHAPPAVAAGAGSLSDASPAVPPTMTNEYASADAPPQSTAAALPPTSLPPTSLPNVSSNDSTTPPPPSVPEANADDNQRYSLIDPPQPIPATLPPESSPATSALPAPTPLADAASVAADAPLPNNAPPSEATADSRQSAYPADNYSQVPSELPSAVPGEIPSGYQSAENDADPNTPSSQAAAEQALPSSPNTPQPLANTNFLPVPATTVAPPVTTTTGETELAPNTYAETQTNVQSAAGSAAPQTNDSSLQPLLHQSAANGKTPADSPGSRKLEGLQTPSVTIEKSAPAEVQVGQPATLEILVRNVGQATAHNVVVQDVVPAKTRFTGSEPQATADGKGTYTWQITQLAPGEEQLIKLHVVPEAEGEIGSIAQVSFQAQASVRTVSTQPRLKITYEGPQRVLIGDDVALRLTISNEGSGAANNVSVAADVPAGLSHPSGTQLELENAIPILLPDEKRTFELVLESTQAGTVICPVQVSASGQQPVTKQHQVEIVAPQMQLAMRGPVRRYLERNATLTIQLGNAGTAPATNVELVARLPQGLEFIEADKKGEYNAREHAVYWFLDQLPVNQGGAVQLRALPVETGLQTVVVQAEADLNVRAEVKHQLQVESLAELVFSVSDTADPIETGTATTYVIAVKNNGDKPDSNIRIVASLPPGLEYVSSTGPTKVQGQQPVAGQPIAFTPLASLAAQESVEYRIQVRGISEGDQKLRVTLQSDEVQRTLVAKEESTRVYRDDR